MQANRSVTGWYRDRAGAGVPFRRAPGDRLRYHLVTPRTFAPPRGTTCTTCTTKGERTGGAYLKPLAAARRPTASNTASTGVGSTPSSRRPGNSGDATLSFCIAI
jgi:hypothetical protein